MLRNMYNINIDGRINLGDPNINSIVSIYDQNFRNQVEDDVWPSVELLINKGYITVGSCSGHGKGAGLHISVIFGYLEDATVFKNKIETLFISAKFDNTYNFTIDWFNLNFKKNFDEMHIVTVYPDFSKVSKNSFLKKLFIRHLTRKINKL